MKLKIRSGNKQEVFDVRECKTPFSKMRGLMFRRKENADSLLFDFGKSGRMAIHSLFVFFPFVAFWLDKNNKVIEKEFVRPFRLYVMPKKDYFKLLEVPINKRYQKKILSTVGKRKV